MEFDPKTVRKTSNSLNREFYRELLYILGLEETKKGNTRYIQRTSEENRNRGSLIENTIRILDVKDHLSTLKGSLSNYGSNRDEQLFNVAMESIQYIYTHPECSFFEHEVKPADFLSCSRKKSQPAPNKPVAAE